ncbi:SGNH/GDSL hydrolase family protein [Lacticaseibacillus saniviri]|uniref:Lipase acylhydrolase n=1 Tax=Lacticaseibacillus saniviri JCM 17471 = DSM 24301 TaxID=1293598 RepID=A0A0R2N2L0_9LACO|nr:SGNH/GDSL hydrolase family protein [Lacticaseibacillus saniviri]KRO18269.1 lipase acylhydrolase [Lacticaseibacillus saniviri JCM 17471 = DSM 24301]MCG4280784.1 SGNH/GDSL hydrolase family protein [Lacticaseibacillus saniviri]
MTIKKAFRSIGIVALVAISAFLILCFAVPSAKSVINQKTQTVKDIKIVGLGDSLTEGVGDETKQGGYLPLIKGDLEATNRYRVTTQNFGVSGNTSQQILSRLDKQAKIKSGLKSADVITVTVGGNDLMAILQKHFFNLSEKNIQTGITQFQTRLNKLLTQIRAQNPDAPIYLLGIYNPFYVYFPEVTALSTTVTRFNKASQTTIKRYSRVYYVDIDSVLSKGTTPATKKQKQKVASDLADNPLIFDQDHFHPNNAGYAQMTKQLYNEMIKTESKWGK